MVLQTTEDEISGRKLKLVRLEEPEGADEKKAVLESLMGFRRAGVDLILTYHAIDAANWLKK